MTESIINSQQSLDAYIVFLQLEFDKNKYLRMTKKTGKQRSQTQNSALHKFCELLAVELNIAGLDMKKVLKDDVDIPWTMESVKENLWKPIQKVVTGHDSTTKPQTHQYGEIYEILNRHLGEKLGIFISWPCKD